MKTFYVTLVKELQGFCIVAHAKSEVVLRRYLKENYGKLWCSVYKEKPSEIVIGESLYVDEGGEG